MNTYHLEDGGELTHCHAGRLGHLLSWRGDLRIYFASTYSGISYFKQLAQLKVHSFVFVLFITTGTGLRLAFDSLKTEKTDLK